LETTSPTLSDHTVMFLDFLGFAHAVKTWDDAAMSRIIEVLVRLERAQSTFKIDGRSMANGSYSINSTPEITTFSDHVVVSYPTVSRPNDIDDERWAVLRSIWDDLVFQQMARIVASLVESALEIGILVRGGISYGRLYHHGRVVVGESMIDAYRMENEFAIYSRIVVSPRITHGHRIFVDDDGTKCLDYMSELMLIASDRGSSAPDWAQRRIKEIDHVIAELRQAGNSIALAKWVCFRRRLADASAAWV